MVMAMQFQDITRQKLEHVGLGLDQSSRHLQALLKGPGNEEARKEIAALQLLEQLSTMEDERRLYREVLQPTYEEPVPMELLNNEADSVTLF
jgi:methyl-accepting chemotaxis protein